MVKNLFLFSALIPQIINLKICLFALNFTQNFWRNFFIHYRKSTENQYDK